MVLVAQCQEHHGCTGQYTGRLVGQQARGTGLNIPISLFMQDG
jgi:hypothetical protein